MKGGSLTTNVYNNNKRRNQLIIVQYVIMEYKIEENGMLIVQKQERRDTIKVIIYMNQLS